MAIRRSGQKLARPTAKPRPRQVPPPAPTTRPVVPPSAPMDYPMPGFGPSAPMNYPIPATGSRPIQAAPMGGSPFGAGPQGPAIGAGALQPGDTNAGMYPTPATGRGGMAPQPSPEMLQRLRQMGQPNPNVPPPGYGGYGQPIPKMRPHMPVMLGPAFEGGLGMNPNVLAKMGQPPPGYGGGGSSLQGLGMNPSLIQMLLTMMGRRMPSSPRFRPAPINYPSGSPNQGY